jgi:hypothetical protein
VVHALLVESWQCHAARSCRFLLRCVLLEGLPHVSCVVIVMHEFEDYVMCCSLMWHGATTLPFNNHMS